MEEGKQSQKYVRKMTSRKRKRDRGRRGGKRMRNLKGTEGIDKI
jgi:hypothetical protein